MDAIVEAIGRGRCVLCLGGELTADGSLRRLIGKLLDLLPDPGAARALLESRPLMAADYVRRRLGDSFADELAHLAAGQVVPEPLQLLGALPFCAVLTTSYDAAVERAFGRGGVPAPVVTPRDRAARPPGRFVFKLLGDPARPETVVWGAADLQEALSAGGYRPVVDELFRTRTFLFLGFDWGDAELALLLERILSGAGRGEHFAALSHLDPLEREELGAIYGIHVFDVADAAALAGTLHAAVTQAHAPMPGDDDVEGWLLRLADDPTRADVIERLDALEARLVQRRDHGRLVELYVGRTALEPSSARRAALLAEASRLYEDDLRDPARALTAHLAAYREAPSRTQWERLERLAAAADQWRALDAELSSSLEALPEADRADAWARLGAMRDEELGDVEGALAATQKALTLEPDHAGAIEVRVAVLKRARRWRELSLALGRSVLAEESLPRRAALYTELADLFDAELADPAQAAACYRLALEADPWAGEARHKLEALLERRGEAGDLIALLEDRVERTVSPLEQAALRRRVAQLYGERLGDRGAALRHLEALRALQPGDPETLRALERLYGDEGRTRELCDVLAEAATRGGAPAERVPLLRKLAAAAERLPDGAGRAADALEELLRLEPHDAEALAALTRLSEEARAWARAVALLVARAALAEGPEQAALYARAAALSSERMDDDAAAESHFARALEADPRHVPSLTGLAQLYRRRGEPRKAARLLADAVESTQNRVVRTRLYIEAAELHERFDDPGGAIALYQRALELDPEHIDAAERASELLWTAGRHAELTAVLALLVARDAAPPVALARWTRLGAAARVIGDTALAERAWRRALGVDADDRESLRGLAQLLGAAGRLAEAQPLYEALLRAHERALSPTEQVAVHHALGVCYHAAGRDDSARAEFALACAIDPTHRPSRLMQLELGTQDPAAVIDAKKALLPSSGRAEQLRLYLEIGDLYLDRFDDPVQAVGAWEAGLRVAPDDVRLLHRLLGVFIEQKAWSQALDVLDRLIRDQPRPETRAKYHYTAGMICLEHLGRFADASEHLWTSVEGDPGYRRAAVALEGMLRSHKSWKELARFYQFVLQKLEPIDSDDKRAEQLRMWAELGELYFERLRDADSAVVALEVARRLDPTARRRQQLATVCTAAGGRHLLLAMAEHRALLAEDKARIASYRALKELCLETGRPDEAAACAEALACLKPDEEAVPATAPVEPRRPLTPELLARLRHPDESVELTALFAIVAPQVAATRAQRERTPLSRQRLLAVDDLRPLPRALRRAAAAFGLGAPAAAIAPDQVAAVTLACAVDGQKVTPVLLLGAPLVAGSRAEVELVFDAARAVTQLRPELLIRMLLPLPAELAHLVEAAMALAGEASGGAATGELGKTTQALKSGLSAAALDQVAAIGHRLRARGTRPQAAALRWLQASDLGVNRAGLVVAGDVRRCAQLLKDEPAPPTALAAPHRILDLIWSSVTDELLAARRHLAA